MCLLLGICPEGLPGSTWGGRGRSDEERHENGASGITPAEPALTSCPSRGAVQSLGRARPGQERRPGEGLGGHWLKGMRITPRRSVVLPWQSVLQGWSTWEELDWVLKGGGISEGKDKAGVGGGGVAVVRRSVSKDSWTENHKA